MTRMTPADLYLLASGFVLFLAFLTAIFEETERGRRFTERAINWILR